MAKAELLFAELFHSLLSLDDVLNIAKSFFIFSFIFSACTKIVAICGMRVCLSNCQFA